MSALEVRLLQIGNLNRVLLSHQNRKSVRVPLNIGNASSLYFQCSALSFIPICTNSILHIVSGVLLNIGKLLCAVAVIWAVALAGGGLAIAVAGAISAVAAVAYLAVTGVSIRDLYRSWKQVIQVKEEGLVTVQSLQPVLTPITPIAGKINYGKIASAAEGTAGKIADAGVKVAKDSVRVAKDSAKAGVKVAGVLSGQGGEILGLVTGAAGGLVLGSVAGNVAQAAAQTLEAQAAAAEAARALAAQLATQAAALEAFKAAAREAAAKGGQVATGSVRVTVKLPKGSVGGGLAGSIVQALGADWVASVAGTLGPQGAEIVGLLTGAVVGASVALAAGALVAVGALLFAGTVAVITCACCCCRSTVEIGPSKVVAQVATNSGVAKVMVEMDPSAIKDAVKTAKIPVISMKEIVVAGSKKDNTEYDVIENYKPQQVSKIKWLNAPPVGGPTMKLVMAVAFAVIAVTTVSTAAPPVIAIAVVSCAFYASAAGAAYVCRRKAVVVEPYFKLLRIFP
ncbi:hypothetical protein AOV_02450 [Anaplasma ovis str. Haibei]|uniref:Uncharacterized protein n=1 Tax=Anaplasma ovis str. Haibei TaxID=1248439 RepID=A0A2Z2LI92_9RICK|nr:hypothetical protein [Anaplasma ovis]ASI47709.1 hypothetical protein AOV_02450 [Anaplasma ovis str. Haibei]